MITPGQCRAARAWLKIGQQEFADLAGVSNSMLKDFEGEKRLPIRNNLVALVHAFEAKGVVFSQQAGFATVTVPSKLDTAV